MAHQDGLKARLTRESAGDPRAWGPGAFHGKNRPRLLKLAQQWPAARHPQGSVRARQGLRKQAPPEPQQDPPPPTVWSGQVLRKAHTMRHKDEDRVRVNGRRGPPLLSPGRAARTGPHPQWARMPRNHNALQRRRQDLTLPGPFTLKCRQARTSRGRKLDMWAQGTPTAIPYRVLCGGSTQGVLGKCGKKEHASGQSHRSSVAVRRRV